MEVVDIDGSQGEGGGQILRTSLALAMLTGKKLVMRNIRAGRAKPGLRRQHLACVEVVRDLCAATVHGAKVGSQYIELTPGTIAGGDHVVNIGTMGSTTLVVQTILVPAIAAGLSLRVIIRGGTHNPMAPPFDYVERVFAPHLRAMGAKFEISLDRHGFVGARHEAREDELGQLTLTVHAGGALKPIRVLDTPAVTSRHAVAILARLPTHIADRELDIVREQLGFTQAECETREVKEGGPANALMIELERGPYREIISELGEKGTRAELVAERACAQAAAYLRTPVPVGEHLADQLLLPLAVAGGGAFRCAPLSRHATTNIETIQKFLDLPISVTPDGDAVIVSIG